MKIIFPALFLVMLAGCNTPAIEQPVTPVVIKTQPVNKPPFNPPKVESFQARNVDWMVVTPDNIDQIFDQFTSSGQPPVIFGVTTQGYENLAINNREALRIIVQQQAVIDGYRRYYVRSQ